MPGNVSRGTGCHKREHDESSKDPRGKQIDGRSSKTMRVYEQVTKISKVAATSLLLLFAVTAQAQWPKPTTPPTPATLPAYQTIPAGFESIGYIEYASVDALCDAVPASTFAPSLAPAPAATPAAAPPTPAACKTAGGWIQVNNDTIR